MASLNQNFNAGETKGQAEEKTKQALDNINDKAKAAKDATQEAAQATIDKAQQTAQSGWEVTQGKAGQVKEMGLVAGQTVKETTESGKDNTSGFLQQTGETIKGAALGATEAVKQTLGIAQNDEDKKP